jgi:hypothetical protein
LHHRELLHQHAALAAGFSLLLIGFLPNHVVVLKPLPHQLLMYPSMCLG